MCRVWQEHLHLFVYFQHFMTHCNLCMFVIGLYCLVSFTLILIKSASVLENFFAKMPQTTITYVKQEDNCKDDTSPRNTSSSSSGFEVKQSGLGRSGKNLTNIFENVKKILWNLDLHWLLLVVKAPFGVYCALND